MWLSGGVGRRSSRERDLPRVDDERRPGPLPRRCVQTTPPPSRTTSVSPSRAGRAPCPRRRSPPVKLATNASAGVATSSCRACRLWRMLPVDDHADPVGERRRVLEVVRDEDRRQRELAEQLVQLVRTRGARVRVERGQRLVEQQHAGSRASARASATRWRSPPESSRTRASARCAIRKRSSSSSTRALRRRRSRTFASDVEVREERVLLEDVADAPPLRRQVDAALPCRARRRRRATTRPRRGRSSPATTRSTVVFPAPDGPTSATSGAVADGQLDGRVEAAKRMGEVDAERHRVRSLTERRIGRADDHEHGADREGDVEVDVELLVDRERERLGDALERAGEHDRRAELADPAGERERRAGAEPARGERQRDAEEDARRARRRASARPRAASGRSLSNADDRRAHVERAGDEGDREDHRRPW